MVEARYDAIAGFYVAGWSDACDDPATAALLDAAANVNDLAVVDLACGHGRVTRALARRGARVLGVDISRRLLAFAAEMERSSPLGVEYRCADLTGDVYADKPARFDVAVCNFGLSDIDDLDAALTAVTTGLRGGGRFVVSLLHPCFPGADDVPVHGLRVNPIRWKVAGPRTVHSPPCVARSGRPTGHCRRISTRWLLTVFAWTWSSSQSRPQSGLRRERGPPDSRCFWCCQPPRSELRPSRPCARAMHASTNSRWPNPMVRQRSLVSAHPSSRIQIISLVLCVVVVGLLAFRDIASGRARTFVSFLWPYVLLAVVFVVLRFRPPTVIDVVGIRRPWRRRAFIPWGEVRSVVTPDPGFYLTRLKLEDGTTT